MYRAGKGIELKGIELRNQTDLLIFFFLNQWNVTFYLKLWTTSFSYLHNKSGNELLLLNLNSKNQEVHKIRWCVKKKMPIKFITMVLKYRLWGGVVVCGKSSRHTLVSIYLQDFRTDFILALQNFLGSLFSSQLYLFHTLSTSPDLYESYILADCKP